MYMEQRRWLGILEQLFSARAGYCRITGRSRKLLLIMRKGLRLTGKEKARQAEEFEKAGDILRNLMKNLNSNVRMKSLSISGVEGAEKGWGVIIIEQEETKVKKMRKVLAGMLAATAVLSSTVYTWAAEAKTSYTFTAEKVQIAVGAEASSRFWRELGKGG